MVGGLRALRCTFVPFAIGQVDGLWAGGYLRCVEVDSVRGRGREREERMREVEAQCGG